MGMGADVMQVTAAGILHFIAAHCGLSEWEFDGLVQERRNYTHCSYVFLALTKRIEVALSLPMIHASKNAINKDIMYHVVNIITAKLLYQIIYINGLKRSYLVEIPWNITRSHRLAIWIRVLASPKFLPTDSDLFSSRLRHTDRPRQNKVIIYIYDTCIC